MPSETKRKTAKYEPGQWRPKRNAANRIEVVRFDVNGTVYETSPVSFSKWNQAKLDADTWNEMEAKDEPRGPGAALATLRRLAGLTVEQAAGRIGIAERFLWHVEDGRILSTPGFFALAAGVYATELQRTGIEPASCGECDATTMIPVHTCKKTTVAT